MALMSLLPKEEKFYVMIDDLAKVATESSQLLVKMLDVTNETELQKLSQQLKQLKTQAKTQVTTLSSEICRTFITPFDREDLQEFGTTLYYIPKLIEKVHTRMLTHKLKPFNKDFNRIAELIEAQSSVMEEIIYYLKKGRKMKEIDQRVGVVHELEDKGDEVLGELIAESFYSIDDTRELILRKDIYEMMEDVTDYYRDCANLALQIVLKHS